MVNKGVLFMFGNTQIKLLVLLITNLELWNSWSNFDIYFQMIAKGQTRRTQTTTNTAWHFASMFKAPVKMSASGPNIMQHITANGYILTDLGQHLTESGDWIVRKTSLLLSTVMTIAVKADTLCVLTIFSDAYIVQVCMYWAICCFQKFKNTAVFWSRIYVVNKTLKCYSQRPSISLNYL